MKHIQRLILTSETWRQSSMHPRELEYAQIDANNRLWWKAIRRRRDAESLRDAMLSASGEIDLRLGGPGFRASIAPEALEGLSRKASAWQASSRDEQRRRSLYMYSKRSLISPLMTAFDFNDTTLPCGQRETTTVPTQSLALLNNQFVHDRSEAVARTLFTSGQKDVELVRDVWMRILGRAPSSREIQLATDHLEQVRSRFLKRDESSKSGKSGIVSSDNALQLSLRADIGVTQDSEGRVSAWKDTSGYKHHAHQSKQESQAIWSPDAFHGRPCLIFDGQNDFLNLSGNLLSQDECTIVVIVSDAGGTHHREILSNWDGSAGNSVSSMFLGLTGKNTIRFSDSFPDAGKISHQNDPLLLIATNGPQGAFVYQNGRLLASRKRLSPRTLDTAWVIGTQGNIKGEYWNGGIAELRVYDQALSTTERHEVENELSERYQISVKRDQPNKPATPELLALASLCHVLFNSNEFLHID